MQDNIISFRVSRLRFWRIKGFALATNTTVTKLINDAVDEFMLAHPLSDAQQTLQEAWINLQREESKDNEHEPN